jgi:DNA replication and repair protein RecF
VLRSVSFRSFRNLADAAWSPSGGSNLIFGLNGAGKSSLLEAVYLAATTRSFRTSRLQECLTGGGEAFHVAAEVEREGRSRVELSHDAGGKWRAVNGASGPIAEHLEVLPVVSWTTRDAEIFRGPPVMRRGFIDRGLISERATALSAFTEYRRALEAKKAALEKQPEALGEWNAVLATKGAAITAMRGEWCDRLQVALDDVLERSELKFPEVRLTYRPSPAEAAEGERGFVAALERGGCVGFGGRAQTTRPGPVVGSWLAGGGARPHTALPDRRPRRRTRPGTGGAGLEIALRGLAIDRHQQS